MRTTNSVLNERIQTIIQRATSASDGQQLLSSRLKAVERERDAVRTVVAAERQRAAEMERIAETARAQSAATEVQLQKLRQVPRTTVTASTRSGLPIPPVNPTAVTVMRPVRSNVATSTVSGGGGFSSSSIPVDEGGMGGSGGRGMATVPSNPSVPVAVSTGNTPTTMISTATIEQNYDRNYMITSSRVLTGDEMNDQRLTGVQGEEEVLNLSHLDMTAFTALTSFSRDATAGDLTPMEVGDMEEPLKQDRETRGSTMMAVPVSGGSDNDSQMLSSLGLGEDDSLYMS